MMKKLNVLLLTRNFPPLMGGMENLNFNLARGLNDRYELAVVGPEVSAPLLDPSVKFSGVTLKPLWRFLLESMMRGVKLARREHPDVVIGGSGLMALAVMAAARASGGKSVLYVHGLDLTVPHRVYQMIWARAIRRVDLLVCNSQPTSLLARSLGVASDKIQVVCPGVDTESAPIGISQLDSFRVRFGLGQRPLLLSVGRLTARKGLREFVDQALVQIVAKVPHALLVVIGEAPDNALHAVPQRREDILTLAKSRGVDENVVFLGRVDNSDLQCAYQVASVHVFPVREVRGDPEGFGMVAIEAAVHGLPTVAFRSGGVTDSVAEGRSGYLVEPEDYAQFARRVCDVLAAPDKLRDSSIEFAQQFAWPEFNARIRACLERVCGRAPDAFPHTPPASHP